MEPIYMPIKEAMEVLGLSYNTLRKGCINGTVPHIKSGNKYMINVEQMTETLGVKSTTKKPKEDKSADPTISVLHWYNINEATPALITKDTQTNGEWLAMSAKVLIRGTYRRKTYYFIAEWAMDQDGASFIPDTRDDTDFYVLKNIQWAPLPGMEA